MSELLKYQVKPHQCPECEFSTYKSGNLSAHINAVHKKIKRYQCLECEYGAFGAAALKRHVDSVHRCVFFLYASSYSEESSKY